MTRTKKVSSTVCVIVSLLAWGVAGSCDSKHREHGDHEDHALWFIHATDPHLYLWLKPSPDPKESAKSQAIWKFQEPHDQDTFKYFLASLATLPQPSGPPAFLLITGDFGADPCLIPDSKTAAIPPEKLTVKDCVSGSDKAKRSERIAKIADLLAASPIPEIYFVAGNNDLALESADEAALDDFNDFFDSVGKTLVTKAANVHLHNLTRCYGSSTVAISDCAQDLPHTSYRIIGFPSQSFKNKDTQYKDNQAAQAKQFKKFRGMFDQAVKDGKKVLIATHIPEIDDPYFIAQKYYQGIDPAGNSDTDKDNPRSLYSAWNIEKALLDDWTKVLASDSLVAVLGGHLHDNHKEIYQRPYSWSTLKDHQMGYHKLFLAPPLSVKNQDGSPIQARGFSVDTLNGDHLTNRFYWFEGRTPSFNPEPLPDRHHHHAWHRTLLGRWFIGLFGWLWDVQTSLDRIATFLIALLTAFLTVVALWQNPASDDPLTNKPDGTSATDAASKSSTPAQSSSPFTTRFGTTIIAGLGGYVATAVTAAFGGQTPTNDNKWYYIICFIFFFFFLLISLNLARAFAEAMRSRVAVNYFPLGRRANQSWGDYWRARTRFWLSSLRVPALTFFDTFINLIQGKNQTNTQAFASALIEQQHNVIRVADTIRKKLQALLYDVLREKIDSPPHRPGPIRVNISVLSADRNNVFYISRTPGSSTSPFPKMSVAWLSVFTGKIRWYQSGYPKDKIVVFNNAEGTITDALKIDLLLNAYYEDRHDDYAAFIVIPFPHPHRGPESNYVKGAIHISFASKDDFQRIWSDPLGDAVFSLPASPPSDLQNSDGTFNYPEHDKMVGEWCEDARLQIALRDAVAVLGELLRGFNEVIYNNYIRPTQND